MNKQDIEKQAGDYSGSSLGFTDNNAVMAIHKAFSDGAEWRINSVWKSMSEKPDFSKLPILLKHKKGKIHFIDDTPSMWNYLAKYYTQWAYIEDLMPEEE